MESIRYAAYGYPMATQDATTGRWTVAEPDSVSEGTWGTFRIEAGAVWATTGTASLTTAGTDITTINDVPTLIDSLTFGEPYGELTGQLTLPSVAIFDDLAAIGCEPGSNIDIYRVLPAAEAVTAGTAEVPYWHGIIASAEISDGPGIATGVSLQLVGALYGEASVRQHQPLMLDTASDVGTWAGRALDYELYSRPFTPFTRFTFESTETNIDVRYRGSRGQSTIDYLDELLALGQDSSGQWTIQRAYNGAYPRARHYYLAQVADDMASAPQQNTVFAGGYGVSLSFSQDVTETANVIYGEGVHPVDDSDLSGSRWRHAVYPMLAGSAPAYPDRAGTASTWPIELGDTDADFDIAAITLLSSQLRLGGWPDVQITDTFGTAVQSALTAWKEDAGISPTTGNVAGTAQWTQLWESGTGETDLSSGWFKPLAWAPAVAKYTYTASGDVAGTAAGYDPTVLRVERIISYGENVPKSRARTNARRIVNGTTTPTIGTITLTSDPTDENGTGRSRLDIRPGSWIQVNNLNGGTYQQFYVSGVNQAPEADGFPTTLTVSTVPYALLDLSTRIERNRAARTDPAKSFYSQRTDTTRPFRSAVGWDAESGAGIVQPFSAAGSAFTVQKFVGAQYGQIGSLRIEVDPPCGYAFAVFGGSVAGTALDALIPNPLAAMGTADDATSHWNLSANQSQLASWGFIEAWGDSDEYAGYWPGAYSVGTAVAGGTITGVTEDAGSWSFASLEPPWLWLAVWPKTSGTVAVNAAMRIISDE